MIPFPPGRYHTILADPPWPFSSGGVNDPRGQHNPRMGLVRQFRYDTMPYDEIFGMGPKVQQLAMPKAHLYLWAINGSPHLERGLRVMRTWGFEYEFNLVWVKVRKDGGLDHMGLGTFRSAHELLLVGSRGGLGFDLSQTHQKASVIIAPRTGHSAKPEEQYEWIEAASPAPRIELFCRRPRDGWACWGNQVEVQGIEQARAAFDASHVAAIIPPEGA